MGKPLEADSASPFDAWKVVSFMFELSFVTEFVITILFWTMIAPHYQEENWDLREYTTHGPATILLLGDFLLNSVLIEYHHAYITLGITLCYITLLLSAKLVAGVELYFFASLDSPLSWAITLSFAVLFSLFHVMFAGISTLRHNWASES